LKEFRYKHVAAAAAAHVLFVKKNAATLLLIGKIYMC
jgi:hypothetical protein